jgi:cytochrome c oxidase subunit 2
VGNPRKRLIRGCKSRAHARSGGKYQKSFEWGLLFVTPLLKAEAPLNYMTAFGQKSRMVLPLTWAVLVISVTVILVICGLVAAAVWRGRNMEPRQLSQLPVGHTASGFSWIYIGVGISTLVLLATLVWTMSVLARTYAPFMKPPFTVVITAHRWWWEAKYLGHKPSDSFTTANEIHIPTGTPVLFQLKSADVIHSFWVPLLNGKMDVIPGQTNITWLDASQPGRYRGQCGEYCGLQHAHMALQVIAQDPAEFRAWWAHQLQDNAAAGDVAGQSAFVVRCGGCHAVRGTDAGGILGPDLSHLMSRSTIAAGTLPNDAGHLSAWIADPQSIKPGSLMPTLSLSGPELMQIRTFLESLK